MPEVRSGRLRPRIHMPLGSCLCVCLRIESSRLSVTIRRPILIELAIDIFRLIIYLSWILARFFYWSVFESSQPWPDATFITGRWSGYLNPDCNPNALADIMTFYGGLYQKSLAALVILPKYTISYTTRDAQACINAHVTVLMYHVKLCACVCYYALLPRHCNMTESC